MIGLILSTDDYREMAVIAAEKFKKHTGLNCIIVDSNLEREEVFKAKLEMWLHAQGQTVVQFDSDLWFCRDVDLSEFDDSRKFYGALDPGRAKGWGAPYKDSSAHGISFESYINTGLMIYNERHHHVMEHALSLYEDESITVEDFGEQSYVNIALQRDSVPLGILDPSYNYGPFGVMHDLYDQEINQPFAVHALGYTADSIKEIGSAKLEALKYYYTKYSSTIEVI